MTSTKSLISKSKNLRLQIEEILNDNQYHDYNKKTSIAVYGLLNAGKSSLLNMLTQHIDKEFFATADIRETTDIKKFEDDYCIYIDTPGLDANKQDDKKALEGMNKADIVLFVHQALSELDKLEVKCLKNLKQSFGNDANSNILIVISKVDKRTPEQMNEIESRILEQCKEFDFSPKMIQISNTRYKKGMLENKKTLIQYSHINDLQNFIGQLLDDDEKIHKIRKHRHQHKNNELIKDKLIDLRETQKALRKKIADKENNFKTSKKNFEEFNRHMNSLKKEIDDSINKIQSI